MSGIEAGRTSANGGVSGPRLDPLIARGAMSVLRIGNTVVTASQLMMEIGAGAERTQVDDAMSRFRLDPQAARDVLAGRAYVWASNMLPSTPLGRDVPFSGSANTAIAMAVMRNELIHPGTAGLASRGDAVATNRLAGVIEGAIMVESRARPTGVAVELQTTSATARAAIDLMRGDHMQAHHLVPAEVWGKYGKLAALAQHDGWRPDDPRNLIALPADAVTQARLAALGSNLPIHNA